MSLLASWLASPPPDAAIEIAADRVSAAVVSGRGANLVVSAHATEPLARGLITPSLTATNVHDRAAVTAAVQRVVQKLGTRPRRVALAIPDTAVKVSLLRFDKVPARREDLDQLVRWQLRKAAPFPTEDALVTYSPGQPAGDDGREFVVELARQETIREYEAVCESAGLYPGLVDIATFGLFGVQSPPPPGDWLLVHVRPDYTSLVVVRGVAVIFYRNRAEDGEETLPDLVHQTAMYYEDRLAGRGFTRAFIAGSGRTPGALETARRSLEERLGVAVEPLDIARSTAMADRITTTPELSDLIGPAVGMLRRTHAEAVPA